MSNLTLMQRRPGDSGTIPVSTGLLRRQNAARRHVIFDAPHDIDRLKPSTRAFRADFSGVPVRTGTPASPKMNDDGLGSEGVTSSTAVTPDPAAPATASGGTGELPLTETTATAGTEGAEALQQTSSKKGKVTSLDAITSSTGALSGFVAIPGGGNLNSPGPFNDLTTGSCKNIHQMKFTLSGTTSSEVGLLRTVNRTATASNTTQTKNGPDGPSVGTFVRPSETVIGVADSPGYSGNSTSAPFPVSYSASFDLYAFDAIQKGIYAKLTYQVSIAKKTLTDSNPTNTLTIVSKTLY
jgi:hypothetical protein